MISGLSSKSRRAFHHPYFFEIFVVANFLLFCAIMAVRGGATGVLVTLPQLLLVFMPALIGQALLGVGIRLACAAARHQGRAYLAIVTSRGWLTDAARLIFFATVMVLTYGWIKLVVPLLHHRLFDQELWDLDRLICFGLSPNVFALELFSNVTFLRLIDWSYANIFLVSMIIAFSFILSAPSRRLRIAFVTGNVLLWTIGAWLYLLVPSVGPAYRFPEVWLPLGPDLMTTQHFQALLMHNYRLVLENKSNASGIDILYGIGAFPSLHVGFQMFTLLWMRRIWKYGQLVFGLFLAGILIGSIITGWHYLIDGLAGLVLAFFCHRFAVKMFRMDRFFQLQDRLVRH